MVPCENPVVLQCVVRRGVSVHINHPAFTNGDQMTCAGVVAMVVFCSADLLTHESRFVGIVASDQTAHGRMHGHVSVFVRGCVTMACDLGCLKDVQKTMVTLAFARTHDNPNRFVGTPQSFVPPSIVLANPHSENSIIGTLVEKGRAPSNEIRLILEPQRTHCHTQASAMIAAARDMGIDGTDTIQHFTLYQSKKIVSSIGKNAELEHQIEEVIDALKNELHGHFMDDEHDEQQILEAAVGLLS